MTYVFTAVSAIAAGALWLPPLVATLLSARTTAPPPSASRD